MTDKERESAAVLCSMLAHERLHNNYQRIQPFFRDARKYPGARTAVKAVTLACTYTFSSNSQWTYEDDAAKWAEAEALLRTGWSPEGETP